MFKLACGRQSAVAAVRSLTVAGDGGRQVSFQIEPPDALVVKIAEVQHAIGPDHETVGIVHFAIRIALGPGAEESGHGWRCSRH
jgi:hypothetical protein